MNYTEARAILKKQCVTDEINEDLKQIYLSDEPTCFKFFDAYYLGLINGKRIERSRRAKA